MLFLPALIIAASFVDVASLPKQLSFATLESHTTSTPLILALDYEGSEIQSGAEPASLQLPAAVEENSESSRCMTVCSRWGEECVMVSPAADVVSQKCVRTCKSFAEECL